MEWGKRHLNLSARSLDLTEACTRVCEHQVMGLNLQGIIKRRMGHTNDLCFWSAFDKVRLFFLMIIFFLKGCETKLSSMNKVFSDSIHNHCLVSVKFWM